MLFLKKGIIVLRLRAIKSKIGWNFNDDLLMQEKILPQVDEHCGENGWGWGWEPTRSQKTFGTDSSNFGLDFEVTKYNPKLKFFKRNDSFVYVIMIISF